MVTAVTPQAATLELAEGISGELRANEFSQARVDDLTSKVNVGDEIEAKITHVDRKSKKISLSVRAKDFAEEKAAIKDYMRSEDASTGTSLGDIFKELKN
ncbi:MAG: hypothetical protein CSA45_06895 [Gammaproteobacteria bacterium]|nr:MAG: hypothetical protein CSA45_06895 [Gammaproteobacteria bacterium]